MFKNILTANMLVFSLVFSFTSPVTTLAATTPSLGESSTYGVLSSTYTNTEGSTINGDVGYTTPPAVVPTVNGTIHVANGSYNQAGTDQNSALSSLSSQSCNFNFGSATDLSLLPQPLVPGVYCITGSASIGTGGITLNGSGTYVFRVSGAFTTVVNSNVSLSGGASACDVFWTPGGATTLGANSSFIGTDIDAAGITVGSTVSWTGRALAFGGTVTTNADTITVPSCSSSVVVPTPINGGWDSWSNCSVTACDQTGTQTRTCTNPSPSNGGAPCSGNSTQPCSTPACSTPIEIETFTPPTTTISPTITPVVIPTLPKTGFPPQNKNSLWNTMIQKFYSFFF
jgi:Ice-binding-like/Thrombospondin type 1 domain